MDASNFVHQSDSRYCFAKDDGHLFLRLGVSKSLQIHDLEVIYGPPQGFDKLHYQQAMYPRHDDGTYQYYETVLESHPSRYYYVFRFKVGDETWYFTEGGLLSSFAFDLAFLSAFQMIAENRTDFMLPKPSWQGRIIYQIFPERFACRGAPQDKAYVNRSWDSLQLAGFPPAFLGGDLYGIIDKLDYLKSLGVGALYLNPIHPSPSNHKYDVLDYYDVDPGFGGKQAFKELVEKAHDHDIKIILDMVFNHTSVNHPAFLDVRQKGRNSPYFDYYFVHGDYPDIKEKNYETFASARFMPKLDTSNPKVQDFIIDVASFWMKEFGVDGFRLDVCEGVSHEAWIRLKMALKRIDPEVLLIGEIWLNSESYLGPHQIDGVMNYPFLGAMSSYVLGKNDAKRTAELLCSLIVRYKWGNNENMLNLLSSHDIQRFVRLAKGDKAKVLCAYAVMFAFSGLPCIYYGDEIFLDGGGDPDCRRGMPWNSKEFHSQEHHLFAAMGRLHAQSEALCKGEIDVYEENGLLVIKRASKSEIVHLYVNLSGQSIPFDQKGCLDYGLDGQKLSSPGLVYVTETKK